MIELSIVMGLFAITLNLFAISLRLGGIEKAIRDKKDK